MTSKHEAVRVGNSHATANFLHSLHHLISFLSATELQVIFHVIIVSYNLWAESTRLFRISSSFCTYCSSPSQVDFPLMSLIHGAIYLLIWTCQLHPPLKIIQQSSLPRISQPLMEVYTCLVWGCLMCTDCFFLCNAALHSFHRAHPWFCIS